MAAPDNRKKQVKFTNLDLEILNNPAGSTDNVPQYYSLCNIKSIEGFYTPGIKAIDGKYHHADKISVVINYVDNQAAVSKLEFDIQDVTNQPGWTANKAGLEQAVLDISTAKKTACTSSVATNSEGTPISYTLDQGFADANTQRVTPGIRDFIGQGWTANITTTDPTTVTNPVTGASFCVVAILVTNASAATGTWVNVKGADGVFNVITGYAAPNGGGFNLTFPSDVPMVISPETGLEAVCETAGAEVRVSVHGYFIPNS